MKKLFALNTSDFFIYQTWELLIVNQKFEWFELYSIINESEDDMLLPCRN